MSKDLHPIGPRRRPPPFYIGEVYKGRATMHAEVERYPNGAVASTRDKGARRLIRNAFGRSLSRIEQHLLKATDARNEIERLSTNGHEARRYWDKALALHTPLGPILTRSERRKMTKPDRAAEQEYRVKRAEAQAEMLAKALELQMPSAIAGEKKHADIVIATVTRRRREGVYDTHQIIAKQA